MQSTFITNYTKFKKRKMQKVKMATGGEGSSGENTFTEFMNEVSYITVHMAYNRELYTLTINLPRVMRDISFAPDVVCDVKF